MTSAAKRRGAAGAGSPRAPGGHRTPRTNGAPPAGPPPSEPRERLVVEAVHVDLEGAEDRGEPRARLDLYLVRGLVAALRLAVSEGRAGVAPDVLVEAAAERDVEHLDAAADREEREPLGEGAAGQLELERVARFGDLCERWVAGLAEVPRVHVAAARQDERVEPPPQPVAGGGAQGRRQQHPHPPPLLPPPHPPPLPV